ncbi:hypothetical protein GPECTOR_27g699 [Gonium pectorale]|uniref:Anaphase-promoting complex subunit 4 WD40 domain-containing protein n=1 Tax=Gonium pectorale TaxID=33097 RepID=A0A150GFD1_GONPE|nr:hypothetical protein GPECTOR_27g699 [Gonium pectorale]|eukprot:KXZ48528.1 hypothetical protein GPECTOR_27g699 [Gonium pectorale]
MSSESESAEAVVALSQTSQIVLIAAGTIFAISVSYFIYVVLGCLRSVGRALASSSSTKAKAKPSKQQPTKAKGSDSDAEPAPAAPGRDRGPDLKTLIKAEKVAAKKKSTPKEDHLASHELWVNTLKDHGDTVHSLAWSRDGSMLATACEDMTLRLFDLSEDVGAKNQKFKRIRTPRIPVGVGFGDTPTNLAALLRGAPDAQAALFAPPAPGSDAYKPASDAAPYEMAWTVTNLHGKETSLAGALVSVPAEAAVGRRGFIVALSAKREGKGREVAMFEPNALANHDLAVSPRDGRFVAAATFSSDVKIWEMKYSREGEFRGLIKVMNLSGHRSQVACVALSFDNTRAATAGKDGMLKIWNIDVRYELSEDPKLVLSIPMPLPEGRVYQHLAFGPPGSDLLAASYEGTISLLSLRTGELLERIAAHDGPVTAMRWCPLPRKLPPPPNSEGAAGGVGFVLASASRDKRVRLWRAPKA